MKILHLGEDEKFIESAFKIYEDAFPGENSFLIFKKKIDATSKFLPTDLPCHFVDLKASVFDQVKLQIEGASVIVYHGLRPFHAPISTKLVTNKIQVWSVYGREVYGNPYLESSSIFGDRTYRTFVKGLVRTLKAWLRPIYYSIFPNLVDEHKEVLKAMKKMDFVAILYQEEYQYYRSLNLLSEKARFLKFTYYPLEQLIDKNQRVHSNNILVGNSASPTNNHLDAFSFLKKFDISGRKVIVPLSYGDAHYAEQIIEYGIADFPDNFEPLKDFMPLKDYQNKLQSCSVLIMHHYRQEAVGNVLNALYMGAKVFLSKRNTLYDFLVRIDCSVFAIEDYLLEDVEENVLQGLPAVDQEKNRNILDVELSYSSNFQQLRESLSQYIL